MRISTVSSSRITGLRNPTYSSGATAATRVTNIRNVANNKESSLNFEFDKEHFYEKLKKHKNEKKEYDKKKQQNSNEKYTFSREEIEMINVLQNVLSNFNKKIDTIKLIDKAKNTSVFNNIKINLSSSISFLNTIGIQMDIKNHFSINPETFARSILKNPQKLTMLIDPIGGVLKRISDCLNIN